MLTNLQQEGAGRAKGTEENLATDGWVLGPQRGQRG